MATLAPSEASLNAMALPIPRLPPVIKTFLSLKFIQKVLQHKINKINRL
jgi:hypothetical protein